MKVIKVPLRISLFGGGTDLPEYVDKYGSTIISFAINRYIYLAHNDRPTGGYRVTYSQVEELGSLIKAEHTLVRQATRVYGNNGGPCTLSIVSDVPKGTGLGSSSALAVALCKLMGEDYGKLILSREAYELERAVSPVGYQDHLPAVFGGFKVYDISPSRTGIAGIAGWTKRVVERRGLLLYTARSREANRILPNWKNEGIQREIQRLAIEVAGKIHTMGKKCLGEYLDRTMQLKMSIPGVVDECLRKQYDKAMSLGALGGKLLGAGGGGCWFFIVPNDIVRIQIREVLGLPEIPFRVADEGATERVV